MSAPDPLRRIDVQKLDPVFHVKLVGFLGACAAHGIRLLATMGFRSHEEQAALYAARKPGQAVAPPGKSRHEAGCAVDFLALQPNGEAIQSSDAPEYRDMEEIAPRYGLRTGRSWKKPDGGHVELPAV